MERHYISGYFPLSGRKEPHTGGVVLAKVETMAEIESIVRNGPFYREQIPEYEIVEFLPSMATDDSGYFHARTLGCYAAEDRKLFNSATFYSVSWSAWVEPAIRKSCVADRIAAQCRLLLRSATNGACAAILVIDPRRKLSIPARRFSPIYKTSF